MEQICRHCRKIKECVELGIYYLCNEHKGLKQYQVKVKKTYELKRTPLKRTAIKKKINKAGPNKVSKKEARNIKNKHKAYDIIAEIREHHCTGCGSSELTHSHLVPVGQNKALEAVVSNITYHCMTCHQKWENDPEGRKEMLDYEENMHKISILDPGYYNLIKGKES